MGKEQSVFLSGVNLSGVCVCGGGLHGPELAK